jgi:hypothetical protein
VRNRRYLNFLGQRTRLQAIDQRIPQPIDCRVRVDYLLDLDRSSALVTQSDPDLAALGVQHRRHFPRDDLGLFERFLRLKLEMQILSLPERYLGTH